MRLYRRSDSGDAVRDIQQRLERLGYEIEVDGHFDTGTQTAVRAFQERRGVPVDGIVGPDTWRELVEADRSIGDRVLYYRRPMMRGDDVARLQNQLNLLGFDAGKEDGIFGPECQRALIEFQESRRLAEDGIMGPVVLAELKRVGRAIGQAGRQAVREREWLRDRPRTISGLRVAVDPACRGTQEASDAWGAAIGAKDALTDFAALPFTTRSEDVWADESLRARHCNDSGADFVLSFSLPEPAEPGVYHFATATSHSEVGARLGQHFGRALGLPSSGRNTPILRETRSPTIVIAADPLDHALGKAVAAALEGFLNDT
ncbi:MAG: peptidoglycan-binding protein [Acidimicrobiia bacterium]|nr:peptidoglycan-binding protein [Acidimicrobiia bacterium]